jgi:hypothetical protein
MEPSPAVDEPYAVIIMIAAVHGNDSAYSFLLVILVLFD